jgi:hypothetical protein
LNFENIRDLEFYIEPLKKVKVNITSAINNSGYLSVNEKNDSIYSILGFMTPITKIVGYSSNYYNSLLIYNNETWGLYKDFIIETDKPIFTINPRLVTNYRINTLKSNLNSTTGDGIFPISLTGRTLFKVFINSIETTSYTASSTTITITDSSLLNGYYDSLTVIHYATDQTIVNSFYLETKGVEAFYNLDSELCDYTYFNDMVSIETINDFGDTITKTTEDRVKSQSNIVNEEIVTAVSNQIQCSLNENFQNLGALEWFRFIVYNPMEDVCYIYSNCRIKNGINKAYNGTVNTKTYTIDFEDRLEIYGTSAVVYGEGLYGVGTYGGAKVISAIFKDVI